MRTLSVLALAITLSFGSVASAQPVTLIIDNFAQTQGASDAVSDSTVDTSAVFGNFGPFSTANTIGGRRVLGNFLTTTVGSPAAETRVINNLFNVNNDTQVRSAGQIIWDGTTSLPAGTEPVPGVPGGFTLNANIEASVSNINFDFQFSVANQDNRTWLYTVRAYTTNASNYFEATLLTNEGGDGTFSEILSINRSAFVAVGTPSWTDVDALSFSASYSAQGLGGDLSLDFIRFTAVPELSTYLALGLTFLLGGACYVLRYGKKEKVTSEVVPAAGNDQPQVSPALAPIVV
jgi:hypothetical protein